VNFDPRLVNIEINKYRMSYFIRILSINKNFFLDIRQLNFESLKEIFETVTMKF